METGIISTELAQAAALIREGKLVAVPTETVYGLAANALDERAVNEIYELKGRPAVKPLSLMVPDAGAIDKYCIDVPQAARTLAEKFWPGPLTIVLKAGELVPELVRAGGDTVGLRCPDHEMTLELLRQAQLPFAAPSANPSGAESPKTAQKVNEYFGGKIAAIVDGGECGIGRESTLIDMSSSPYKILRNGALDAQELGDALAEELCIIGITGGTGAGKSTALAALKKMGALVIDADEVYHELLSFNQELLSEIEQNFKGTVFGGVLNRRALGAIVFADAEALSLLNSITHKYVSAAIRAALRAWALRGGTLAAIDAIALIGSPFQARCKAIIGVLAENETRVQRIMKRDAISRSDAQKRIDAQKPDSFFIENCTYVLENNGSKNDFLGEFNDLITEVLGNG